MKCTAKFKQEAVRVALISGLNRKQVAADFNIGFLTLNKWIQHDRKSPEKPSAQSDLDRENAKLRKGNRLLRDILSPLVGRTSKDTDFIVVHENVEGEYSEIGGCYYAEIEHEGAVQQSAFTRCGVDRVMDSAFKIAIQRKRKHVSFAT